MTKLNHFFALSILALFIIGCSTNEDQPIVFKSLTTSKGFNFIEETASIIIDGTEYSDADVSSNNSIVTITKLSETNYAIEASEAGNVTISVQLKNNDYRETKSIDLEFYEHGVKDFKVVEGIKLNIDKTGKILALLGEPDAKTLNFDASREFWYYFSEGVELVAIKATDIVTDAVVFPVPWSTTVNGVSVSGNVYPYDIANNWNISNGQLIMDEVIEKLGEPDSKFNSNTTGSRLKRYVYSSPNAGFRFYSDDLNDYSNKPVSYIVIY